MPLYWYPAQSNLKVRTNAIGHLVNSDGELLCGMSVQAALKMAGYPTYEIRDKLLPGHHICHDCKRQWQIANPKAPTKREQKYLDDLARLERWNPRGAL